MKETPCVFFLTIVLKALSNIPSIVFYCFSIVLMFGNFLCKVIYKHYKLRGGEGDGYQKNYALIAYGQQLSKSVHVCTRWTGQSKNQLWILYILHGRTINNIKPFHSKLFLQHPLKLGFPYDLLMMPGVFKENIEKKWVKQ